VDFVIYDPSNGNILTRIAGVEDMSLDRAKTVFSAFGAGAKEVAKITSEESALLANEGNNAFRYDASSKKVVRR